MAINIKYLKTYKKTFINQFFSNFMVIVAKKVIFKLYKINNKN